MLDNPLLDLRIQGANKALYSCCSANEYVIKAAARKAVATGGFLLVESTANQVNQFGGYTGMTPKDFKRFVTDIATSEGLDSDFLLLGGDHLGPLAWVDSEYVEAMSNAEELVRQYVEAGYVKIHLDTSMHLSSDDKNKGLDFAICAERGARLCKICEDQCKKNDALGFNYVHPVYVIGSEVPVPGGARGCASTSTSTVEGWNSTLSEYRRAFEEQGLKSAFERIIAVVVEMGVEFAPSSIKDYDPQAIQELSEHIKRSPLGFEAHSTDYQTESALRSMVSDGARILKVGPAFTFALREALTKLEYIERELVPPHRWSHFREVLERVMLDNDAFWKQYYSKGELAEAVARSFSFSDRSRYYLSLPAVKESIQQLIINLCEVNVPQCVLSCFFPNQYKDIREGTLGNNPEDILLDYIGEAIDPYLGASNGNRL